LVLRTTTFTAEGDRVEAFVADQPGWRPFEEFAGKPLRSVKLFEIAEMPGAEFQMVEIASGGHFAMHTSPDVAFCQVIRGRGKLVLPEDRELDYSGPELYIFHPGSFHEWRDIEEDTLLSVCLVKHSASDAGA
jgi:quercetin dioxygenase-like cupin family protein